MERDVTEAQGEFVLLKDEREWRPAVQLWSNPWKIKAMYEWQAMPDPRQAKTKCRIDASLQALRHIAQDHVAKPEEP